ncbi:MAG: hypothetical protein GY809_17140, partial [Planctomycetes bacterium]|nr:hypothetical protein [Planctomycetota bacterium]
WRELIHYIQLLQNMRQGDDPLYFDMLEQVKVGKLKKHHKPFLMDQCVDMDGYILAKFSHAVQIVASNAVRQEMNKLAFQSRHVHSGTVSAVHAANDFSPSGRPIRKALRDFLLQVEDKRSEYSPSVLYLATGHEVVLKDNMAVELGLCNGTRAFFRRWVEDPNEPQQQLHCRSHVLRYPPLYVIAEVKREKDASGRYPPHKFHLSGLEPGHFPIPPQNRTMKFENLHKKGLSYGNITVTRRMPPLLPAQCVMGHGAQGMALDKVVVGLAHPPPAAGGGTIKGPYAYVGLSRAKKRE